MHVTKYTDYALRTLIYLATTNDRPATIKEIAGRYGISRNHLMKIVHQLATAGIVTTERGRGGGIRLGITPSEINIGRIVRLTEDDLNLVECFSEETDKCLISPHCGLKGAFNKALAAFLRELDAYTLADFTNRAPQLAQLLSPK